MMDADNFNPYHVWLGISGDENPPNHYRLLGLDLFESDLAVIKSACERQASHVRKYQAGEYSEISQRLLSEIASARLCLTKPDRKAVYDAELRSALGLDSSDDSELETDEADIEEEEGAYEDVPVSDQVAAPDDEPKDEIEPDDLQGTDEPEYVSSLPTGEGRSLLSRIAGWAPAALLGLLILGLIGLDWLWLTGRTWNPQPAVLERGFQSKVFKGDDGKEYPYVVFVPHERSILEKPPLFLFLSGGGPQIGSDGIRQIRLNVGPPFWEKQKRLNFVAVFPQSPDATSFWSTRSPNAAMAINILDQVAEEYGTDPDRQYLSGLSAGAAGTMDIMSVAPDRFAAVMPVSQAYFSPGGAATHAELAQILAENKVAVWSLSGAPDAHAVEIADQTHLEMLKLGMSPRHSATPATGHGAWFWAYRNPMVWDWLLKQSRTKNAERVDNFQLTLQDESLQGWTADSGKWEFDETGRLQASSARDSEGATLMLNKEMADFDLHFETQFVGSSQFVVLVNGLRLVVSQHTAGNGGLLDPKSGEWLASNDAIAERELFNNMRSPNAGNEARLRVQGGRLTLELNGWPALDVTDPRLSGSGKVGFHVGAGKKVSWYLVRMREL